ncbi:MAG: shikimate dehydrogenase [Candidatus Paceibacterota bacterium]|jgi:shikimate dehydrogenase
MTEEKIFMHAPGDRPASKSREQKPIRATELWFRESEKTDIADHRVHATVRAGDRSWGTDDAKGGYRAGGFAVIKIQKEDGTFDRDEYPVVVTDVRAMPCADVTEDDLVGALSEEQRTGTLREKLERLYGTSFEPQSKISIVRFEYVDQLKAIDDLIRARITKRATLPPDNNEEVSAFESYTMPLIGENYPAKTAAMWNAAYRAFDMPSRNVMMVADPDDTENILRVLRGVDAYAGGGMGVGFKDEGVRFVDDVDPLAKAMGAINFVVKNAEGKLTGYNTDGIGYRQSVREKLSEHGEALRDARVVLLGAGGTANAIAFALMEDGAQITIVNRTIEKAQKLADRLTDYFGDGASVEVVGEDDIAQAAHHARVIINTTTKGASGSFENYMPLAPAGTDVEENNAASENILSSLDPKTLVSDIVLRQDTTPFLAAARQKGFLVLDGVPMVINQAIEAFWILYGASLVSRGITKDAVGDVMRAAATRKTP